MRSRATFEPSLRFGAAAAIAGRSGGSRTTATSARRRPGGAVRPDHFLDVPLDVVGERPEGDDGDPIAAQHPAGQRREGLLLELVLAVELALEVVGAAARRREVALQALLEVLRRPRDHLVPEADPDQDPDRKRDEHGCERCGVVAPRIPHIRPEDRS